MKASDAQPAQFNLLPEVAVTGSFNGKKNAPKKESKELHPGSGHRARLRERFLKAGFAGFADHEIIELILTLCIPRRDVKPAAKALIKKFGSLRGIFDARLEAIQEIDGLGTVAPVAIKIIKESANLYLQEEAEVKPLLNSVDAIIDFWRLRLGGLKHEVFEVGYLDTQYYLMKDGVQRLEEGIVDRANVYPRKVMESALRREAANIVIVHNHPSGILEASPADLRLTKALVNAGNAVGVHILEHLIITADGAFSFCDQGLI